MKDNDKNKESSYLKYWDVNELAMPQKLPEDGFKSVEKTSQFNEDFIRNYNGDNDEEYFFGVDVHYSERLSDLQWFTTFTWKNQNGKSWKTFS